MTKKEEKKVIVVPEDFGEAVEPLEASYLGFAQSAESDLSVKLDRLLAERDVEANMRQKGVIALLASGRTQAKTAELMGIHQTTVWRIKKDPNFDSIIQELREVFAQRMFQWALGLIPYAFRALYDNLIHGDLDQRRMASLAVFRLVGDQLAAAPPPNGQPRPPRVKDSAWAEFGEAKDPRPQQ